MNKNIQNNKKNNKGFTLVELIIVVAIIAVLAAVLAPQYLRYVERARQSNDLQVATSIMRATTAAVSDPQIGVASSETLTVTWTTTGTDNALSASGSAVSDDILNEISATMGWATQNATTNVMEYDQTLVDDAQSAAGNGQNFVFRINAATGQIDIMTGANVGTLADNDWLSEIGVTP